MDVAELGEFLALFLENIAITDTNGSIIWTSRDCAKNFRYSTVNHNIYDIFGIELKDFNESDEITKEIHNKYYLFKMKKIIVEKFEYYFVVIEDISESYCKDNKIFALESIIQKINDGILMSDKLGKIAIYNNAMEKLEDRRSVDMIEKYLWDAYGYHEVKGSEHRKVYNSGNPIVNRYAAHAYNNGQPKYVSYSTYPIIRNGEKIGVFSISKNETKLHSLLAETIELKRKAKKEKKSENTPSYKTNGTTFTFSDIIGTSDIIKRLIREAESISWLDNNILLIGETGTGKEVFAQSIHNNGKRCEEPFIGINCSAIPENLLESILFGTVKGAFTGAIDSKGLFEEAKSGTLFLDELNSMPLTMQTKLLRVLQEKRVRPVGGNTTYPINCRIVSAMNENPDELIKQGKLREDLFYRIAGFNLFIPALKEREKDVLDLSDFYIRRYNSTMGRHVLGLSKELKELLLNYCWPGNVRELQYFIENAMVRVGVGDKYLSISHIPDYLKEKILIGSVKNNAKSYNGEALPTTLNNLERKIIVEALGRNKWNISRTAKELGIIRQSLLYRIKKLDVERK